MIRVLESHFAGTAVDVKSGPPGDLPEVACVGRSNVGKSSLLNALLERRKLVRVSHTPGRTRTLNFFDATLEVEGARRQVRLVDLPGYGFAKASKTDRQKWKEMVAQYLHGRRSLKVVIALVDAEIGPTPDDAGALETLAEGAPRVLVVATKIDRLPSSRRRLRVGEIARTLELPEGAVLPFSATKDIGRAEVWDAVAGAVFPTSRGRIQ